MNKDVIILLPQGGDFSNCKVYNQMKLQEVGPKSFLKMLGYAQAKQVIPKMWQLDPQFAGKIKQTDEFKQYGMLEDEEIVSILGIRAEIKSEWKYDWIYLPFVLITTRDVVIMEYVDRIPNHQFVMMPLKQI